MTTIPAIIAAACAHFRVSLLDVMSVRRDKASVSARHVTMALARELTTASIPAIGRALGRDHTTVLYAISRVRQLQVVDPIFLADYAAVRRLSQEDVGNG